MMFRAISLCILLCLSVSTEAAEIGVIQENADTVVITVSGFLEVGDDRKFAQVALQYQNAVVALNSPGGHMLVGIELGRAIRLKGFSTKVDRDALCASACDTPGQAESAARCQPAPALVFMPHTCRKMEAAEKPG
jgi:hypothetical protein